MSAGCSSSGTCICSPHVRANKPQPPEAGSFGRCRCPLPCLPWLASLAPQPSCALITTAAQCRLITGGSVHAHPAGGGPVPLMPIV